MTDILFTCAPFDLQQPFDECDPYNQAETISTCLETPRQHVFGIRLPRHERNVKRYPDNCSYIVPSNAVSRIARADAPSSHLMVISSLVLRPDVVASSHHLVLERSLRRDTARDRLRRGLRHDVSTTWDLQLTSSFTL